MIEKKDLRLQDIGEFALLERLAETWVLQVGEQVRA